MFMYVCMYIYIYIYITLFNIILCCFQAPRCADRQAALPAKPPAGAEGHIYIYIYICI